jgi:hypothetical protein
MRGTAAAVVALGAFLLYRATLLPDFDLGDTASFQTMGGLPKITPRDAYPLYYALARPVVLLFENQAYAMNLLSAVEAAAACGLIVLVAFELSGSLLAATAAALLFAGSYTFWSQAVIAEVYGLHILLVSLTLLLLLRWAGHPTFGRLCWFMAAYALAFGNHLSIVLLLPAYVAYLFLAAPRGWRSLVSPRVLAAAVVLASLGALQYAWNLSGLWRQVDPPASVADALRTFWFDVTKADWRETMVLEVPTSAASERLRMYMFDLLQQFGWLPPIAAVAGFAYLVRRDFRRLLLLLLIFAATVTFALGYNVGDAHVFFLPSHLMVALLAGVGIAAVQHALGPRIGSTAPIACLVLAGWNIFDNYPALDRSEDRRPLTLLTSMTEGLSERNALIATNVNWQIQNGLTYFGQHVRPDVLHAWLPHVLLYAPPLFRDNRAIGRDIVTTEWGAAQLEGAFGPLFTIDRTRAVPTLESAVSVLPAGARYVLCLLTPAREFEIDRQDLARAIERLTGGSAAAPFGGEQYTAMVGRVGNTPVFMHSSNLPFRERLVVDGLAIDIRMESWLAFDTIRRMGFGHVVANRHHSLIVERGISFAALDDDGRPTVTAYAAGIFEPQPRYVVLSSK